MKHLPTLSLAACLLTLAPAAISQTGPANRVYLEDAFAAGWMLLDTNGDGIIDGVAGKVVVPANPSAAANTAAAEVAARIGYASTGLTPPLVISAAEDRNDGPRIWIGAGSAPAKYAAQIAVLVNRLQQNEGGVFELDGNVVVLGQNDAGLLAASEAYAAHAPFLWKAPGEKLAAIAELVANSATLSGLAYRSGFTGISRVFLRTDSPVSTAALEAALKSPRLDQVHEVVVAAKDGSSVSYATDKALTAMPPAAPPPATDAAAAEATPARLDLATLYTMRGLFRGTPKMPIPSNLDSQLYIPAGKAGTEMANLAARMGLETTGITLPLAKPASGVALREVRTKSVIAGENDLTKEALGKLSVQTSFVPGEGELRIVDQAFGRQATVLARGDDAGAAAAVRLLASHFPNLWEPGKQYGSLEEIRYDLHKFFSLRSGPGQASAALYRLTQWADQIKQAGGQVRDVEAKVFVDIADPKLADFVRTQVQTKLGVTNAKVEVEGLHAGLKCCSHLPSLHYTAPERKFQEATPTFEENIVIPWEGTKLVTAVRGALSGVKPGQPVNLFALVSEGIEERQKLKKQLTDMLLKQGADAKQLSVTILCAFKPAIVG